MKKIKITEKSGASIEYINDGEVINRLHLMGHGLPERIVDDVEGTYDPADVIEKYSELVKDPVFSQVENSNDPANIPEAPVELEPAVYRNTVKLKAEYTVEIIDITAEHALKECITNRKAEYPTMEEFLNAYFDGGEVAVQELQAKRIAVKAKYPKP